MKLLLVNTLYPPQAVGGAERVVQALARALVRRGDEVTVLCLSEHGEQPAEFDEGVKVRRVALRNIYWPFATQASAPARLFWHGVDSFNPLAGRQVARVLREERPDVVHTHNLTGFSTRAWAAVEAAGLPLVHTLHDYYLLCPRTTMYRDGRNCATPCTSCSALSRVRRGGAPAIDEVVGVSRHVLERHEAASLFDGRTGRHVVHNGMTHAGVVPRARAPRPDAPAAPLRVGFMGRVEANKGIEVLLDALALLPAGSWQLAVAGRGDAGYLAQLRARHPSPDIAWLGVSSLENFFDKVDVSVVPSLWNEPLGMVAFESFFFGVPVVAARRGGLPEIVTPETGLLFDPDSAQSLADALAGLQRAPGTLAALAEGALRAAARFEPDRMCDAYQAIYRGALAARPQTGDRGV